MASKPVHFHPLAADESQSALGWYDERSRAAGDAFQHELDAAVEAIGEAPQRWPRLDRRYRRFLLRDFPFSVVYWELGDRIEVIAVALIIDASQATGSSLQCVPSNYAMQGTEER